jgi:hypothetical protein
MERSRRSETNVGVSLLIANSPAYMLLLAFAIARGSAYDREREREREREKDGRCFTL